MEQPQAPRDISRVVPVGLYTFFKQEKVFLAIKGANVDEVIEHPSQQNKLR
jgi:hypothetical protein